MNPASVDGGSTDAGEQVDGGSLAPTQWFGRPTLHARGLSVGAPVASLVEISAASTVKELGFVSLGSGADVELALFRAIDDRPAELVVQTSVVRVPKAGRVLGQVVPTRVDAGRYFVAIWPLTGFTDEVPTVALSPEPGLACSERSSSAGRWRAWDARFADVVCDSLALSTFVVAEVTMGNAIEPVPEPMGSNRRVEVGPRALLASSRLIHGQGSLSALVLVTEPLVLDGLGWVAATSTRGTYSIALYDVDADEQPRHFVSGSMIPRRSHAGANVADVINQPLSPGRYRLVLSGFELDVGADGPTSGCAGASWGAAPPPLEWNGTFDCSPGQLNLFLSAFSN